MDDNTNSTDQNNTPAPTRARTNVPKILKSPNGDVIKLTRKMRGIIRRIPTAKTQNQIAVDMKCDRSMVGHVLHMPAVQQYLREQMESAGITHGLLMQRLREGLDATKEDKAGGERVDFSERREHTKLALRLQGLDNIPEEKENTQITNNTLFNIVINARKNRGLESDNT
jgi:hypothetical protein